MAAPPPPETAINLGVSSSNGTPKQTMNALSCGDYHYGNINPYFLPKEVVLPVPAKKDRHSKIFTAQGLRDRRVRLSINVAREFFDLQDLLGFDKASKTLEWLLTKSRKAIRDLTRNNNNKHVKGRSKSKNKTMSSTSECEDVSDVNEMENAASKDEDYKMKMKKLNEAAKESRAKARARARERTKEKLMGTVRSCPQILNQLRMFSEISEASSSSKVVIGDMSQVDHHSQDQSIVTKRRMKDPCSVSNYQQKLNGIVSDSMESSNGHNQFGNAAQNWDINGAFTSCPSICAITNMNLSTGL